MARFGERFQDLVRQMDRRRHQRLGLGAGVAEHDALVARALVFVAVGVHALGNIAGLAMQMHGHIGFLPVEAFLLIADFPHGGPGDLLDMAGVDLAVGIDQRRRAADLAGDDDPVGRRQGLAGHPCLRVGAQKPVDDGVGNPVANLVRMAFGDRFAGEQVVCTWHGHPPSGRSRQIHGTRRLPPGRRRAGLRPELKERSRAAQANRAGP